MSKKEMMQELLEKMSEKEISLLYCFAIGMRAGSRKDTGYIQTGKGRKEGMIALLDQKQGQEEKVTAYRFGDDERELTAGEKEAYAMAGSIAEKIHRAGLAAAAAQFSRMTYKEL